MLWETTVENNCVINKPTANPDLRSWFEVPQLSIVSAEACIQTINHGHFD